LLLIALPSCAAVVIVRILATLRQALIGLEISAHGEREADAPWRLTAIHLTFRVRGQNLQPETVRKAVELAESKCCLVAASLRPQVKISYDVEIVPDPAQRLSAADEAWYYPSLRYGERNVQRTHTCHRCCL